MTKLEQFRIENKFTYQQLRDFIANHGLDVHLQSVYRWCMGPDSVYKNQCGPRPKYAKKLAEIINCSFEDIYRDFPDEQNGEGTHKNPAKVASWQETKILQ